jgi:hypothetical protein
MCQAFFKNEIFRHYKHTEIIDGVIQAWHSNRSSQKSHADDQRVTQRTFSHFEISNPQLLDADYTMVDDS